MSRSAGRARLPPWQLHRRRGPAAASPSPAGPAPARVRQDASRPWHTQCSHGASSRRTEPLCRNPAEWEECTRRQRQTVTLDDAGLRLLVAPFGVSHQQHHWRSTGSPPPPRCSVAPTRRRGPCSRQQRDGRTWSASSRHTRSQYAAEMARLLQHHQRLGTLLVCLGVPLVAYRPQPDQVCRGVGSVCHLCGW